MILQRNCDLTSVSQQFNLTNVYTKPLIHINDRNNCRYKGIVVQVSLSKALNVQPGPSQKLTAAAEIPAV